MKNIIISLLFVLMASVASFSQCRVFAEEIVKQDMEPFIHDGNFNAVLLDEGQNIEINKAFNAGQAYRLIICGSANLPNVEFQVLDNSRNLLYTNKNDGYVRYWDFMLDASQQLIIKIKVPENGDGNKLNGCVTALFGLRS